MADKQPKPWEVFPSVFHFRRRKDDGKLNEKGGITVVYDPQADLFGVAVCSRKDAFMRRRGFQIAKSRIESRMDKHGGLPDDYMVLNLLCDRKDRDCLAATAKELAGAKAKKFKLGDVEASGRRRSASAS